jgi:N-acetylglucosamine transport system permease protein
MGMKKGRARSVFIWVCVAPAVILFTVFMLIPTFNVFKMSLYKWGGYSNTKEFVGFNNFKILMEDMNFFRSFQNTILLIVCVTIVTMALSLIFAAILSREKIKGQNFYRIIFYIPNILSVVVISAIFSAIYDPNNGLLNSIIGIFRGKDETPILWLGDQKLVIYSLVIAMIWQAIGYYMVMYMASMASVPESLYESANLEGAGRIQQFFSITLPLIWTNVRTTLTFFVISSINLSFLFVKALTSGGPDGATEVFLSYMYKQAYTNSSYGYGMAIGVVVFLFSFGLSAIVNLATKREPLEF